MRTYAILVNTCDNYEDCWEPFFQLFSKYWGNCRGHIFLNTEFKNFTFNSLDIKALKVSSVNGAKLSSKRNTWSECLKWALERIDSEIILYLQEDYFLKAPVKNEMVENFVELMQINPEMACIHLTDQAVISDGASKFEHLNKVRFHQRYRVSCQAALWRKSELLNLLREYEDAWEFEEFGSMRSAIQRHDYYVVNENYVKLNQFEIIPYIFTGIVQGKWFEEVVPLFEKHKITVDYNVRGFLKNAPRKSFKKRVAYRLKKIPKIFRNLIELRKLKREIE
jgi:hypothetical protein